MNNNETQGFRDKAGEVDETTDDGRRTTDESFMQSRTAGEVSEGDGAAQGNDLAAEYLDALQRERASFLNYKRRTEQDREDAAYRATSSLLKKLLPVVDDFDRALSHVPEGDKNSPWVEGVMAIARKFHAVLESEGVERIESLGQPFDPNLHEAVAFDDNGGDNHTDTVSEVYAQGYRKGDRVLRPAMVRVARG